MHALRIARAYTGRKKFIKFEGQYHGMADYFMFSTASSNPSSLGAKRSPVNAPVTSGIPKDIVQYIINFLMILKDWRKPSRRNGEILLPFSLSQFLGMQPEFYRSPAFSKNSGIVRQIRNRDGFR